MKRFEYGQRVMFVKGTPELVGMYGTVARLRFKDNLAWVKMDEQPPKKFCPFPVDDEAGRWKHVLLDPSQCEAV